MNYETLKITKIANYLLISTVLIFIVHENEWLGFFTDSFVNHLLTFTIGFEIAVLVFRFELEMKKNA